MCFNDWRVGRFIKSQTTKAATSAQGILVVPPSNNRVGLTAWHCDSNQPVNIVPDVAVGAGIAGTAASGHNNNHVTMATHGDVPMKQLTLVSASAAVDNIYYTEYFAPEWLIRSALESWERDNPGYKPKT